MTPFKRFTRRHRRLVSDKAFGKPHRVAPRDGLPRFIMMSLLAGLALGICLSVPEAVAGTGGVDLPWNTPFQNLLDNLTGTTARIFAAIMLVIGGCVWGFTKHEEGVKRFGQAVFAIAIMFGAIQIVDALAFAGALI